MALRIDHLNKKLAALGVTLVRSEEGFEMECGDHTHEVEGPTKLNDWTEEEWLAEAQVLAERVAEEEGEEEEEEEGKMSETLRKYRLGYEKSVSYSGNHSLDNGDEVAELMRGMSPQEACALADKVFGQPEFTHWEKYQHLNPGSRRMNAGNRIRAAFRREEFTIEDLKAWAAGKDLIDDEADV